MKNGVYKYILKKTKYLCKGTETKNGTQEKDNERIETRDEYIEIENRIQSKKISKLYFVVKKRIQGEEENAFLHYF